jgi:hypothetical protein
MMPPSQGIIMPKPGKPHASLLGLCAGQGRGDVQGRENGAGASLRASAGASQREIRDPMTFDSFECANGSLGRRLARGQLPDLPRHAEGAVRPVPCIVSNRTGRSCMHYFVHCLVGCTPYISITEVLWQQLGYVMKVLAAKVVRQLEGKRLDLFELCFVECKKHSPLLPRS